MYKKSTNKPGIGAAFIHKIWLIMRLTTVLLIATFIQVSASGFAQKINIDKSGATLKSVLKEIRSQSGYNFVYPDYLLNKVKPVHIRVENEDIKEVLIKLFKDEPIDFTINRNTVTLKYLDKSLLDRVIEQFQDAEDINQFNTIDVKGVIRGENNLPLVGATIKVKGSDQLTISNKEGEFLLKGVKENAVLVISFLGYESREIRVVDNVGIIKLVQIADKLEEVGIVSTGYQTIDRSKTTGSFVQIDNQLLNRSVSTNILDRIKDVAPGIYFENRDPQLSTITKSPTVKELGINIRGVSTFTISKNPLIILNNFPFEGEINNINPNDIESITILKDASSASVWGAQSANGVIVINTKKGQLNQKLKIDFSSNLTVTKKPDLKYSRNFINSTEYINIEQLLFDNGYFESQLNDNTSYPIVSPAVELMVKYNDSKNENDRLIITRQLDKLRKIDIRDDYSKYVYRNAFNEQYSLGLRGGAEDYTYTLSTGLDKNKYNLNRNGYNRISIHSLNTYSPIQNLELTAGIHYAKSITNLNNSFGYGSHILGGSYIYLQPYIKLVDENDNPISVPKLLRNSYLEETFSKGFLDWHFRPLDEINLADNKNKVTELTLQFRAKYQIIPNLNIQLNYQNQRQFITDKNYKNINTYETRDLINKFSNLDANTGLITYLIPKNGILDLSNTEWEQNNLRGQINFDKSINKHNLSVLLGAELRELLTNSFRRTSYGYNDLVGTSVNNLDYQTFHPINPSGSQNIQPSEGAVYGILNRNISYFSIANYYYDNKYFVNLNIRKDGANLFGAKVNDKIKPFWSIGLGWNLNNEKFYDIDWLPKLRLRTTFGYQGNTYDLTSGFLSGYYAVDTRSGATILNINNAPNSRLQWEKIATTNIGLDFNTKNQKVSGSIEIYQKIASNLIQSTNLAPQTGFSKYLANTGNSVTRGIDIQFQSQNLNQVFKWNTSVSLSFVNDKIKKYDLPRNSYSITTAGGIVGRPIEAVFSYKWAGLNSSNGNPKGYLNGDISEDYSSIIANYDSDSLVYNGSLVPTIFGAIRNDFTFKQISLSINISYRFGYVFRKISTSLNYPDIIRAGQNTDYYSRWQKSGDEKNTNVPSITYDQDYNKEMFYTYSEHQIEKGDHIRLQDIRLSYKPPISWLKKFKVSDLNIFAYANSLGIIWRKNKLGIDPSTVGIFSQYPLPSSVSLGVNAKF